jgi:arsenate reductase (thioredoxin)
VTPRKYNVAFICLGNACRSQMAEGFARAHGQDVITAFSAGLSPLDHLPPATIQAMQEKNIDITDQYPKEYRRLPQDRLDLVINLSGFALKTPVPTREWTVMDPYGLDEEIFRDVRDQIETLVMNLVMELKRKQKREQ